MDIPFATALLSWQVRRQVRRDPVLRLGDGWHISQARNILLVATTGLGDAILSTPVIPAIRRAAPQADIQLFCKQAWVSLFRHDPALNGVIPYPGKFRRFFSTLAALKEFAPDTALILHANDPDVLPLCYLAGARRIVRVPTAGTRFASLLSNREREEDRNIVSGWHYVDNRLRLLDTLGVEVVSRAPRLVADPQIRLVLEERARRETCSGRYVVLHTYSADTYRSLPIDLVKQLLAGLTARFPAYGIILTGSREDAQRLAGALGDLPKQVWLAAGKLSMAETAACLAGADGVISPDTGILHLAAALDCPLVALFAPTGDADTREQVVGPRTVSAPRRVIEVSPTCTPCVTRECSRRPVTCLAQFNPERILAALSEVLPA